MKILLLALNAKYIHTNPALYSLRQYAVRAAGKAARSCAGQVQECENGGLQADTACFCAEQVQECENGSPQATAMRFYAEHILLREYTINHEPDVVLRGIYELRPQVLCISCYLWNIRMVRELVADYKKLDPEVHIYLGGPEVSFDATECLRQMPELDGIMVGEGEETFWELARYYFGGDVSGGYSSTQGILRQETVKSESALENATKNAVGNAPAVTGVVIGSATAPVTDPRAKIRSLTYRAADGTICANPLREPLDFSALPFPYADMDSFADFEHKIIYYETSRGCPFSCCYCLSSVEKSLRLRNLSLVDKELQIFLDRRVAQVKFVDRTFNCNKAHAMHIWQYIHDHDNGVTNFHFEIAADLLDDEQVALLAKMRPRLVQLEIGVQSTNPRTVEAIHRRMDLEKVAKRVAQVQQARNIHQHLDLIAGLPYEDYASFSQSFDDVYRMEPDQLQLGFLKVLKGSAMADMTKEHGIVYKSEPPYEVLSTKYLPYADLLRLKDIEEMVEVYYNSGQFLSALPYLEAHFARPFELFEKLAAYYRENGLLECKHGRMERYEILYRFAGETVAGEFVSERAADKPAKEDFFACLAECLCYDLYSRERPKVLPSFVRPYPYGKQQPRELFAAFGVKKEHAGQCYVAHFCYDMEEAAKGRTRKRETDCLFDYTERDPLSGVCMVRVRCL